MSQCSRCRFYSSQIQCCDYLSMTGTRRGCPGGDACTKFAPKKGKATAKFRAEDRPWGPQIEWKPAPPEKLKPKPLKNGWEPSQLNYVSTGQKAVEAPPVEPSSPPPPPPPPKPAPVPKTKVKKLEPPKTETEKPEPKRRGRPPKEKVPEPPKPPREKKPRETGAERNRRYRDAQRCIDCGGQDWRTLSGKPRCEACAKIHTWRKNGGRGAPPPDLYQMRENCKNGTAPMVQPGLEVQPGVCATCGGTDYRTERGFRQCRACYAVRRFQLQHPDQEVPQSMLDAVEETKAGRGSTEPPTRQSQYARARAQHRCASCGQMDDRTLAGKAYCEKCTQATRDAKLKRAEIWRGQGLCEKCGLEPPREGSRYCEKCLEYIRGKQVIKRRNDVLSGRCHSCGNPVAPGFSRCEACLAKQKEYQERYWQKKEAEAAR